MIKKNKLFAMFVIFIFISVMSISIVPVEALTKSQIIEQIEDATTIQQVEKIVKDHFSNKDKRWFNAVKDNHMTFLDKLDANNIKYYNSATVSEIFRDEIVIDIREALIVIGRLFCFLYFLLDLMEAATRDSFTIEHLVKSLIKLVLIFVIFNKATLDYIIKFATGIEQLVITGVNTGANTGTLENLKNCAIDILQENLIGKVAVYIEHGGKSFTLFWIRAVIWCVCFGRLVELVVYQMMLPIGMASIYNGGANSSGMRYIKKYLALHIQGAIMLLVLVASARISAHMTGNVVVLDITSAMIVARSRNIANDVMGV